MIDGIFLNKLRRIPVTHGDVYHGLKASDDTFKGFGELYFSRVDYGKVKGWKRHNRLTLNLMVPVGEVRFVVRESNSMTNQPGKLLFDSRVGADTNHARLTIPPGYWVAFQGVGRGVNVVANIIPEEHDPGEADNLPLDVVPFDYERV